jgi:molybdate transport repressor ModE-like protein
MRVDPNRLLVLDAVATAGSVTGAARQLNLVPSGISQHLAALERETGVSIIDRSQRGGQRATRLTSAGQRLAVHAARIRAGLEQVEVDIALLTEAVQGQVTLGAFPTVLRHLVLPAREHVMRTHEAVRVRIIELNEPLVRSALHAGDVDIAFVERDAEERLDDAGLAAEHLLDDRYQVAVPNTWATPTKLTDLGHQPWIEGPPNSVTAAVLDRHRQASGLPFAGAHSCLEYPAVLDLVDGGLGAALVPDLALRNHPPRQAKITQLPGLGGRAIYATYLRQRRERRVVRAVLDSLQAAADDYQGRASVVYQPSPSNKRDPRTAPVENVSPGVPNAPQPSTGATQPGAGPGRSLNRCYARG